jgi:hypothetical protein
MFWTNLRARIMASVLCIVLAPVAGADWQAVGHWDELRAQSRAAHFGNGGEFQPAHMRSNSALFLAMFSAMNAVEGRYTAYFETLEAVPGADAALSGHAAAASVIAMLFPEADSDAIDAALEMAMADVDETTRLASLATGEMAARAAFDAANETVGEVPPYRPFTVAGRWVPTTPPAFRNGLGMRPFLMESVDSLAPPGPPALDSDQWAMDFNEVREIGREDSELRTAEQSYEASFWVSKDWEPLVVQLAERREWSMYEAARVYALVAMATSDAGLATGWAKDHFQFWRPITSIRNADLDGREDTEIEADWEPYLDTPRHPEYPCAHCSYGAAVSFTLEALFDLEEGETLNVFAVESPDEVQVISTFDEFSTRMSMSRLYGGVHYRTSNDHADEIGRQAAELALGRFGAPVD